MTTPWGKCDEDINGVNDPERILQNSRRIATVSSAAKTVGNPPIASQFLDNPLQEVGTPAPTEQGEDTTEAIVDLPVSAERLPVRNGPTCFTSTAKPKIRTCKLISSIPVLVEATVIHLFRDAGQAMASSPDKKVISVI